MRELIQPRAKQAGSSAQPAVANFYFQQFMSGTGLTGGFCINGSSRLLLQITFCRLFLLFHLLFPTLVLILLAFVSHCLPPFCPGIRPAL
jgi:hypothetical protein